jgi:hypothetical protein
VQLKELLEDRDDLLCQIFMDDQGTAVGLSVEADVGDVNPPQLLRVNWAAGVPAWAEVGGADRLNGSGGWGGCGGRRLVGRW